MFDNRPQPFRGGQQVYFDHGHGGHPFLHFLALALFVALIALVVYAAVRYLVSRSPRQQFAPALATPDGAIDLVRMRYARGEIERDDFLRMSADLGDSSASGAPTGAEPPGDDAPTAPGG